MVENNKEDLDFKLPMSVSLEINNICNADCSFCGYGKDGADPREKGKVSEEVFKHTLELVDNSDVNIFDITPTLGEVGVDSRWLDLIKEAKKHQGINTVRSYTNAINLHKFGFDNILTSGLDVLQLSSSLINNEMYKRLYGVDKFDQVSENILNLCKKNYELGFPVDIYLNLRIDLPKENFFKTTFYKEISKYLLNHKITFLEKYDDYNGVVSKDNLPINAEFVKNKYLENNAYKPCYQLYRVLQVNYDGIIQGCACRVEPELWSENILEHNSLESAWKNIKLENIREKWLIDNDIPDCCIQCSHYYPYTNLSTNYNENIYKTWLVKALKRLDIFKYLQYIRLYSQRKENEKNTF